MLCRSAFLKVKQSLILIMDFWEFYYATTTNTPILRLGLWERHPLVTLVRISSTHFLKIILLIVNQTSGRLLSFTSQDFPNVAFFPFVEALKFLTKNHTWHDCIQHNYRAKLPRLWSILFRCCSSQIRDRHCFLWTSGGHFLPPFTGWCKTIRFLSESKSTYLFEFVWQSEAISSSRSHGDHGPHSDTMQSPTRK